ncbi:response regulator [Pseudoflavitalea sp. G-6-1-2]|uniref:response regulator n=1 Tax=Pseudoflavitalea sp. G-6-1-2 TaxID=2728841 RepID=UPI00146B997A|nr:response regulator [Pseudoflavitalea sp. G-6-1-2]NML19339.1 response regulator [Pseudoflavitalea sp. G-6-1-2]
MKKLILAIDDSKAIRFLLQTVLGKEYQVVTAPDGCSAMFWLSKRNLPGLIITDAQHSDMQDWELVEQLSSSGIYKDIPMIVLSSLDKAHVQAQCEQFGVSAFFTKPFNPVDLMAEANRLLDNPALSSAAIAHAS